MIRKGHREMWTGSQGGSTGKRKLGKSLDFLCVFFPKDGVCSQASEPVLLQHACPHSLVLSSLDAPPVDATGVALLPVLYFVDNTSSTVFS